MLQSAIDLEMDGSTNMKGRGLGKITVSVVFRPVDAVARSGTCTVVIPCRGGSRGVPGPP